MPFQNMNKRFRVAFSFASEKRFFVAEAAGILSDLFSRDSILYDHYHEAEFARYELAFHLPNLYRNEADLVVVVLCDDYSQKDWCGLEFNSIYSLFLKGRASDVLLTRFDRVEPVGMHNLAGYIDLDDKTPGQLVELIQERLAINEGKNRDFYKRSGSMSRGYALGLHQDFFWPAFAEPLGISVANHIEPQKAFIRLLQTDSPFQLLLIEGERLTGKTHLSNEFLGAAMGMDLRCGRLDFKGTVDLEHAFRSFAAQLGLPSINSPKSLATLLADLLQAMIINPRPTVLLFDTYESAGEADGWVNSSLLVMLMRNPWLRIVISGQTTVASVGVPWSRYCNRIRLGQPTPEEWWDFATSRKPSPPELTLEFVRQAYAVCQGKSNVLAGLLDSSR
jgi:hypothetical protein